MSGYMKLKTFTSGIILCLFIVLSGCAGSPPATQRPALEKSRMYGIPFDAAWKKLTDTLVSSGEFITLAQKENGLISFQKVIAVKDVSKYAYDDSGMLWSQAVANIVMHVSAVDETRTRITINVTLTGTGRNVMDVLLSRNRQAVLDSKGWLERSYFDSFDKVFSKK